MFIDKSNAAFNNAVFNSQTISAMHESMERLYRAAKEIKGKEGQTSALPSKQHEARPLPRMAD